MAGIAAVSLVHNCVSWAGTNKGVSRFDGKQWKSYTREDGLMDDFVYAIGVDQDNNKWFGTRFGVSKLMEENVG